MCQACYAAHGVSRVFLGITHFSSDIEAVMVEATQVMLACMKDDAITVQFYAAMAISQLVFETESSSAVVDAFPQILETIIKVRTQHPATTASLHRLEGNTNQSKGAILTSFPIAQDQIIEAVGTDELIPALNSIISHLNLQQLTQYAVVLCKHLTDAFSRVASRALEDDNSAMLAVGCLSGTAISPTLSGGHANAAWCAVMSIVAKCRRPGVPAGARSTHMRVSAALSGVLDSLFNVKPKEPDDSVEFQQQVAAVTALLVPWLHTLFTGPGDNIVRCAHRTHTDTHLSSHS